MCALVDLECKSRKFRKQINLTGNGEAGAEARLNALTQHQLTQLGAPIDLIT